MESLIPNNILIYKSIFFQVVKWIYNVEYVLPQQTTEFATALQADVFSLVGHHYLFTARRTERKNFLAAQNLQRGIFAPSFRPSLSPSPPPVTQIVPPTSNASQVSSSPSNSGGKGCGNALRKHSYSQPRRDNRGAHSQQRPLISNFARRG